MVIAREISKSLSDRVIISKVNNILWDLDRPLEEDAVLEFFDFDTPEGLPQFCCSRRGQLLTARQENGFSGTPVRIFLERQLSDITAAISV